MKVQIRIRKPHKNRKQAQYQAVRNSHFGPNSSQGKCVLGEKGKNSEKFL